MQPRSQRDFVSQLQQSKSWQDTLGFVNGIPVQTTFSRYWNNPGYHDPLDDLFLALQKLVGLKKIHFEYEAPPELMRIIYKGYFPFSVDASFIPLSEKRFDHAKQGYSAREKEVDTGAKLNLMIGGLLNISVIYVPTSGNVHEKTRLNVLIDELLNIDHSWLTEWAGRVLKLLFILDHGYWDKKRFLDWNENGIVFLCQRKA